MRRNWIFPVVGMALTAGLVCGCGEAAEGEAGASKPSKAGNEDGIPSEPVADACDCFEEGLSRAQQKYCRESKRNVAFLEALRKCGTAEVGGVSAINKMPGDGQYTMNVDQSLIQWQGSKATMAESGTVPFRSCTFQIQNSQLISGSVVVEMNAIQATSVEGLAARNLSKHLRSEDFFNVSEFPTAAFIFERGRTDGRGNLLLQGKLNIKGISKPASAVLSFGSSDPVVASVNMVFNRADFDVRFGSGSFFDNLGDDLISDEVNLKMVLVEDVSLRK